MSALRTASWSLLFAGLAAGTLTDKAAPHGPVSVGGYRVLEADFHLHTFPLSASTLTPWDLMWDGWHDGLDAVAISGHNEAWSGHAAHWMARQFGGPTVMVSEEIHGPKFHMVAVGIHSTIGWRLTAAETIREIHRQGGVAIAAHPAASAWPAYDTEAMQLLDAAEVLQPFAYTNEQAATELRTFYARKPMTAIASSDWHGLNKPGLCRTLVFVHANTEAEILQAIRERRTVVYDRGQYFGDPVFVKLAQSLPVAPRAAAGWPLLSCILAFAGLVGLLVRD